MDNTSVFSAPWLASLRNSLMLVGREWRLPQALTDQQRRAIQNLSNALTSQLCCDATNDKAVLAELLRLFAAFPAGDQSEASTRLRMESYVEALRGIPAWAVSEARRAALRGEAGCDLRFAPTPPQLAALAKARLQNVRDELTMLRRIERAAVEAFEPAPEEHARVSGGFGELLTELGVKSDERLRIEAVQGLEATCRELGIPTATIAKIPDAPERTGTFRRPRVAA